MLCLLQSVLKSTALQIHIQKSKAVCKINCNGILLYAILLDARQLLPENGLRGKKYANKELSVINS